MSRTRLALVASVVCAAACSPESPAPAPPNDRGARPDEAAAAFLAAEVNGADADTAGAYVARTVDGGEPHPRLTLAYLSRPDWCGSGGCTLVVLGSRPGGVDLLGRIPAVRPPIRMLTTRSNHMPDLGVTVCGGGITECHETLLHFDGRRYASDLADPSPVKAGGPPDGEVVISEDLVRLTFASAG